MINQTNFFLSWLASKNMSSETASTLNIMEIQDDLSINDKERMKRTLYEYGRIFWILAFQAILFVIAARIWY